MGRTHSLNGLAAGFAVGAAWAPSPVTAFACGAVGLISSAVPDTDHAKGVIPRMLGRAGWLVSSPVRLVSVWLTGVAHRGITHSLACAVVCGTVVWRLLVAMGAPGPEALALGVASLAGVAGALVGDAVSRAGLVWLFWPLRVRVRLPLAPLVGGRVERWVVWPVSLALLVWSLALIVRAPWVEA